MTEPQPTPGSVRLPIGWMTVRQYAVDRHLNHGDINRLGLHGKAAMAEMRRRGISAMPQVWEQATSGQWFWVYVYPAEIVAQAAWQVWA